VSWFLAFAGFALLVILHEAGHFTAAKAVGMRVERFSLFFPPTLLRKKVGETEYAIGAIPAGGYVKISGMNPDESLPDEVRTRAYYSQPVWKRIVVISAGPAVNLGVAFLLLLLYFAVIGPETTSTKVGAIQKGFPAAHVLKPGEKLVAVDGKRGDEAGLAKQIASHRCAQSPPVDRCKAQTPAKLLVRERDGTVRRLELTPIYDASVKRTRLGFSYAAGPHKPMPFGQAFDTTTNRYWYITKQTVALPARLFNAQKRKQITGVVGSYEYTRQTILTNIGDVIGIMAIISLSLAIVNLFPFLPLDGGHIFWAIVEKIRRQPVPFSVMERAGVVGFMLVIGLFILGLTNDIDRLSGQGFQVR
jgi:regulator of sigma E protease